MVVFPALGHLPTGVTGSPHSALGIASHGKLNRKSGRKEDDVEKNGKKKTEGRRRSLWLARPQDPWLVLGIPLASVPIVVGVT